MSVCTTKTIFLLQVSDVQNPDTGVRTKTITGVRKMFAEVTNVGTITQMQAVAVGTLYSNQIELREKAYKGEAYVAFKSDGSIQVYDIKTTVKGRTSEYRKLNVQKTKDIIEGVDSIA